jgi:hypothetical protein
MLMFRIYLIAVLIVLLVYTGIVISTEGMNLFPVFFGDIAEMKWPGQFNMDFMFMLTLSALWTAWRNDFSAFGLGLAVVAFLGGMPYLTIYLSILIAATGGDMKVVLLGPTRARG